MRIIKMNPRFLSSVLVLILVSVLRAGEFTVLTPQIAGGDPRQMLSRHLKQDAYAALENRLTAFEQIKTPEEAKAYVERRRAFFIEQLGGFP